MTYKVIVSPKCLNDIEEIFNYIMEVSGSASLSKDIIYLIQDKIKSLSFMPKRFAVFLGESVRLVRVKSFMVLYKVLDDKCIVQVLRVIHEKMNVVEDLINIGEIC